MHETAEGSKEAAKVALEEAVADFEQIGDGERCVEDCGLMIKTLQDHGQKFRFDRVQLIEGPVEYYNHKRGGVIKGRHHAVVDLDRDSWVIDPASAPYNRVYEGMQDYKERSGLKILKK